MDKMVTRSDGGLLPLLGKVHGFPSPLHNFPFHTDGSSPNGSREILGVHSRGPTLLWVLKPVTVTRGGDVTSWHVPIRIYPSELGVDSDPPKVA